MTQDKLCTPCTFDIICEEYKDDGAPRQSYGIVAYSFSSVENSRTIIAIARDLTSNRTLIEALAEQCNRLALSPIHLLDVVDDLLDA